MRLVDDGAPNIRAALAEQFAARPEEATVALREFVANAPTEEAKNSARMYLDALVGPDVLGEFREFIRSQRYEFETGMILLHRIVEPRLEAVDVVAQIDRIADRCRELIVRPGSVREICRTINRVLYHEWEFRGDTEDFENPANSLIGEVLERRRGLPLTLGLLYLLVGRRVGLDFEPICLPGRFMVAHFGSAEPVYVDAFDGGRLRSLDEVADFLRKNDLPASPSDFAPASTVEVLVRMCRNLSYQYEGDGEVEQAALFADLANEFAQYSASE
jgi:regulator of sirC expression with transglutaminase-like and TPR domain